MNESLEDLKAIIDNAPEDATHYSIDESCYYKFKCECLMFCHRGKSLFEFVKDDDYVCNELRSLSDIKRIIELTELLEDIQGLGFLEESSDSGVSHRGVCRRAKQLQGVQ